jgi:F-type H+-transporting ATPase subunit a
MNKFGFIMVMLAFAATAARDNDNPAGALMDHVTDGHQWHPLPMFPAIPLPDITIGPVKIRLTQDVLMLFIVSGILCAVMIGAFGRPKLVPTGLSSAIEPIVFFIRDSLVVPVLGPELSERWLPFFYTQFFFLLAANLLGLVPLFPSITGNLSITGALAAIVFLSVVIQGMLKRGVGGFFLNMVPKGIPWPIGIFLLGIETAGLFIRNSVLAIRLFANMIAGHFVVFSLLLLIIIVHPLSGIVSIPLALFIDLLEVLVAIIQAVVFTTLSAIFISMAVTEH